MRVVAGAVAVAVAALLLARADDADVTLQPLKENGDGDIIKTVYNIQDSTGSTDEGIWGEGVTEETPGSSETQVRPWDGWLYGGLAEGMIGFRVDSERPRCARDGLLYRQSLDNLTLWAVRMFDSSALSANGLASADGSQLGHFDDCVAIEVQTSEASITGKYCLAALRLGPDPSDRPRWHELAPIYAPLPPTAHVWDRMKVTGDPRQMRRDRLRWAVCVPSSCSAEDVRLSLSRALATPLARRGVQSEVTLTDDDCYSVWEAPPFSVGYFIVMGLMYIMLLICILCTVIDYGITDHTKMRFSLRKFVEVFSIDTNLRKLVKPKRKAELKLLYLIKFLSMQLVILGHKAMYVYTNPIQNTEYLESFYSHWSSYLFLNGGNFIVDSFFVVSGFLTCHFTVRDLEKRKSINLPVVILNKILRILPVYAFVLAFHAEVLPYLGSGPLWNQVVWRRALRCQKNWWTNMLFLNNYFTVEQRCMVQSWYLACDMHFFIVGTVLISVRHRHRRLGSALIAAAMALAVLTPAYITYVNRYWGVVRLHHGMQMDQGNDVHYRTMYVPSHTRFIPYMVGLIMSYVCQHLLKTGFKFHRAWLFVLIPLSLGAIAVTACIAFFFYVEERPYNLFENVLYAGVHRTLWSLALCFIIIFDCTIGFGSWGSVLRHSSWVVLGKLTYCAFLVHTIPMLYSTGMMRSASYYSRTIGALSLPGEVALSFILALFLHLIFESPLLSIKEAVMKILIGAPPKSTGTEGSMQQVVDSLPNDVIYRYHEEKDDVKS